MEDVMVSSDVVGIQLWIYVIMVYTDPYILSHKTDCILINPPKAMVMNNTNNYSRIKIHVLVITVIKFVYL